MSANGALRFAWIWLPLLALFLGTPSGSLSSPQGGLRVLVQKSIDEWDSDVVKKSASQTPPPPSHDKGVEEWVGDTIK